MANIPGTQVPAIQWTDAGFLAPTSLAILAGVQADYDAAFGGSLSYALTTPQGQLASSEAAVIDNTNALFLYYVQQVDPAYASGRMQDAIGRIYDIDRDPAEPTVLQVSCSGGAGVTITTSATIQDGSGNLYICTQAGQIPASGPITLPFAAVVAGPTPVPPSVSIYQAITGWDSATVISGVIGQNTETRQQFEARRQESVAKNSVGQLQSVLGAVLAVPGVLDAYVTENVESTPMTIGGYALTGKSLYVAAVGGSAQDIGDAIWSKKAPGCDYNGNTNVTVTDNSPQYNPPKPTYDVKFETPDSLAILFRVVILNSDQVPADAVTLIQNAIIAAFSGSDGGARARIGSTIFATRYAAAVVALGSWVQLESLRVGSNNNASANFTGSIAGTSLTVTSVASGAIGIDDTISDIAGNVIIGTKIVSQQSGPTGGIGSYTVSLSQSVISSAMISAPATLDSTTARIDQSPTITAANIDVELI